MVPSARLPPRVLERGDAPPTVAADQHERHNGRPVRCQLLLPGQADTAGGHHDGDIRMHEASGEREAWSRVLSFDSHFATKSRRLSNSAAASSIITSSRVP
jgi:hypothetical protein